MFGDTQPLGMDLPGTYEVSVSGKKTTIKADRLGYDGPNGNLQAWKDGSPIAVWAWWDSIVRTGD